MQIEILMLLVMSHYLCDFALQGDFIAKFKSKYINDVYNPIWPHVLAAHCAIHAMAVLLITDSSVLAGCMFVSHFIIDYIKCQNKITFKQDQMLHLMVVCVLFFCTYF